MSPEQAKGKTVDKRSDIWAFGAVLFEMLASKPAFAGDDVSEILASVIKGEVHLDLLPANLHPRVREAITRCLQKDLKKRYPDIVDARYEIEQSLADSGGLFVQPVAAAEPRMRLRTILAWIAATAILSVLVTGIVMRQLKPSASPKSVSRLSITLPASQRLGPQMAFALSPDGTKLAYVASQGNTRQIYLRRLDSFEAEPLAGTEGAQALSFSPDGQWLGFTASDSGRLMKVPIQGGAPLPLADVYSPTGMCWGENGTILLSPNYGIGGLVQISATGSSPIQVTRARDTKSEGHRWPQLLPGGQAVLFTAWRRNIEDCRIMVHFLKTGRQKVLVEGGTDGRYVPTGHLIFVRQGSLFAVPFDAERMELKGTSVPILNGVGESREGAGWLSVSNQGSLVYSGVRVESIERVLVWVDREGKEQPLEVPPRPYISPRLSPDGNRIAVTIQAANDEIWSYDIPNRKFNRLTFQGRNSVPVWTPDGKRIAFRSDLGGDGALNLFWMLSDGSGAAERLMKSEHFQAASSWSPDGKFLALNQSHPTNNNDIWILPLDKALKPYAFLQTRFAERGGAFSPDGRWIAYSSNETGQYQVHIRPFPGPGGVWQVSTDGGDYPVWARNWELFYSNGNKMMAVKVETIPTFNASPPKMLFEGTSLSFFDVTPDGKRFLKVKSTAQGQQPEQINVVLNWTEELKQRVPAK
jgi:serine/threonine-protein kinase